MLSPSSCCCGESAGSVTETLKVPELVVVTVVDSVVPPPEVKPASGVGSSSAVLVSRWKVRARSRPGSPVPSGSASRPVTLLVAPAGASCGLVLSHVMADWPALTVRSFDDAIAPLVVMVAWVRLANSS